MPRAELVIASKCGHLRPIVHAGVFNDLAKRFPLGESVGGNAMQGEVHG